MKSISNKIYPALKRSLGFKNQNLKLNDLILSIDGSDSGGRQYFSKGSFEELASPFYNEIKDTYNPGLVLDIGANYGFTGLVFAGRFPEAEIVLIEPSRKLCQYIRQNFQQNSYANCHIINAICSDTAHDNVQFSLNPNSSQDNRVIPAGKGWKSETVPSVTIDSVIQDKNAQRFIFIKIDTQGFEERVFKGGETLWSTRSDWLVKTEFAPHWLNSQGTDPVLFLKQLVSRFNVAELPLRFRYKGDSLPGLFAGKIEIPDVEAFVTYIQSLNKNGLGWCDLLISPKQ